MTEKSNINKVRWEQVGNIRYCTNSMDAHVDQRGFVYFRTPGYDMPASYRVYVPSGEIIRALEKLIALCDPEAFSEPNTAGDTLRAFLETIPCKGHTSMFQALMLIPPTTLDGHLIESASECLKHN